MSNTLRYILYKRKSSEARERQALSIKDQDAECKKVAQQEGLVIVAEFEESKSAFKPNNRPLFNEAIKLIKENKADALLMWKEDRICRNPQEGGLILQLLQDRVIREIRSVAGGTHTSDSDHLILQIHFGMANQYSRNISQNVKRALKYKVQRGEYYRCAPLGYEVFGEQRGTKNIRPNIVEAGLLKEAFEFASTGFHSLGYITNYLFERGLRTKKGKVLSKSHIRRIFDNPVYYGYFYYQGELYKGDFVPIITKNLFDKVHLALGDRTVPKVNSWKHPYNGLLKCSICGCGITTSVKRKYYKTTNRTVDYVYHNCTKRRGKCAQAPISGAALEAAFQYKLSQIAIDEDVWTLGMNLVKAKHEHEVSRNDAQLTSYRKDYDNLQDRLNRLIRMRADEEINKDEFMEQKNFLLKERASIENRINDTKYSSDTWFDQVEKYLNTAFYVREVLAKGTELEKRGLIMDVCSNLTLNNGTIGIVVKDPLMCC